MKVLLVEDNPGDARLIQEMLSEVKVVPIYVQWVDQLTTALKHLAKEEVDVTLLDLSLPDSRGLDTLARLRAEAPLLPIVVVTGLDDEEMALKAVREGAQDYLVKGQVDGNLLVRALRYAIERKRTAEELEASKKSFLNIVEKGGDGILVVDRNRMVCFVNPALETLFGRTAEELLGEAVSFPLVAGGITEVDIVQHGDGVGIGEMHVVETEWEGERAYLLTVRDITRRKQAEEAVQESEKKAVKALEELTMAQQSLVQAEKLSSLGQLVAGVAHELNNPLTSIRLLSQVIMNHELDDTLRNEIVMISEETECSVRIVENLLSFARRSEAGKVYMSANSPIEAALELRRYELTVNNIDLEVHLQPDLPLTMVDPHEIQQVALNLIVNAEQAMLGARGEGKLLVKTEQIGPMIHVVVSDNGPGLSKENLGKVFDPFFTTKDVGQGTGLGLSLSYGIIQNHGGRITAESEPSNGATFTVQLPIVRDTTEVESEWGNESQEHEQSRGSSPQALRTH